MTEKKLCGWLAAATVAAMVLYTGNGLWSRGHAVSPETLAAETPAPQTELAALETEPELPVVATVAPPDPDLVDRLGTAAENMDGTHIFVYDLEKEQMLYCAGSQADVLYPASITKLYTAWLALQYLEPETVITAGQELTLVQKGSSLAYISKGCRLTVEMLVEGMLLPSGNDAAYVLAAAAGREISGDPNLDAEPAVQTFVAEMNREAFRLGLQNSYFTNPDGFHEEDHYSCPYDMAVIGELALKNATVMKYAGLAVDTVVFESGERITWYNTNRLVNPAAEQFMSCALGLKTGYTGEAGHCLLAAFEDGEKRILVGIFGAKESMTRYENAAALWQCCG